MHGGAQTDGLCEKWLHSVVWQAGKFLWSFGYQQLQSKHLLLLLKYQSDLNKSQLQQLRKTITIYINYFKFFIKRHYIKPFTNNL